MYRNTVVFIAVRVAPRNGERVRLRCYVGRSTLRGKRFIVWWWCTGECDEIDNSSSIVSHSANSIPLISKHIQRVSAYRITENANNNSSYLR